jgi:hypothetical protein
MSDEHGWPDFSHSGGHEEHDTGGHDEPVGGADSPFHDDLFGHDDGNPDGFDDPGAGPHLDAGPDVDGGHDPDAGPDPDGGRDVVPAAWDDQHEAGNGHDDEAGHAVVDVTDGHSMGPVGADPDAAPDLDQAGLFPPVVDVGPLPEPVDGFPWIDTGSLGLYHSGLVEPVAEPVAVEPVPAEDLAAYAAEELPPGVDPWAALADSDDPAASALAKWWQPES